MNKRDLKADLKFCDRATQGPWRHEWNPDYSEVYAPGFDNPIILVGHDPYDADFIVQAREGWPHAIERALKAEALARELVATLKKAHEYIGDINSFYGQGLQVHGWHLNGAPEPLDNFIDSNGGCEAEEFVGRVLTKAKEVLGDDN